MTLRLRLVVIFAILFFTLQARLATAQEIPGATTPQHPEAADRPQEVRDAAIRLKAQLEADLKRQAESEPSGPTPPTTVPEAQLSPPEKQVLAETSTLSFRNPVEVRSANGELRVTLTAMKVRGVIGEDPVHLRSYNGSLVGPTLRAKPGDILRITLKNDLEPEVHATGEQNTFNRLNTTNLHTHGLHVSPNGISDNVLLELEPRGSQEYEVKIPSNHAAGTFWYHAHRHGSTAVQVGSGMSGALIVEGGIDNIPAIKSARERVFILQQIPYCYKNVLTTPALDCSAKLEGDIELPEAATLFLPNAWPQLGRFTTINGDRLPVIRIQPGAVERWRFVHSGTRDVIKLAVERSSHSDPSAPERVDLNEIARDGLPLGYVAELPTVEMYPGYRSDVLFAAPPTPGAEYLLVDEFVAAGSAVTGIAKSRRYLARIIVEGAANAMTLPTDGELAPFKLPSLGSPTEVVTDPSLTTIVYGPRDLDGPDPGGPGPFLSIDGKQFDHNTARQTYVLGDIVERTLTAPALHVFHIHVNPFEIIEMKDENGVEHIDDPEFGGKHFRDTVVIKRNWSVKIRMQLADYAGLFVQHCHLLQHEDNGMMDLVEIKAPPGSPPALGRTIEPYASPEWRATTIDGVNRSSEGAGARPAMLVFFEGFGCLLCNEQLAALNARRQWFERRGVDFLAISNDGSRELQEAARAAEFELPLAADPELKLFRRFACAFDDSPLHGIFIINSTKKIVWQHVSREAYTDVDALLRHANTVLPADEKNVKADDALQHGAHRYAATSTE